jgi:ADP-heptose:LPS heptosyltransferase
MKVDTMRKIDYFAGVPLTFLGTLLIKLKKIIFRQQNNQIKNVLFIELSEMGSTILVDPAMKKLKRQLNANLHFVIFKKNKASLKLLNTIPEENIYTIREDSFVNLVMDTLNFFSWTRNKHIDTVIDLELFSRFTALLSGFSGAERVVGFHSFHNEGLYRGDFLTHKVAYNSHIHISKNFIALVNALIDDNGEIPYSKRKIDDEEIKLDKAEISSHDIQAVRESIAQKFKDYSENKHKLVLINPNASELLIQRRWPPEYYSELMKKILSESNDILILITGAPNEFEEAEELKKSVSSNRCINFAGGCSFLQLPALYSISEFMITNDSGPGHFSAVTNLKTFVFFGPETPDLYGSLGNSVPIYAELACSPCVSASNHRKTPCKDNKCLQVITPDRVMDIIKGELIRICDMKTKEDIMPKNELKKQIEELKIEKEKLDENSDLRIIHLKGIIQDVELKIIDSDESQPETKSIIEQIEETVKKYEVEHPKITKILNKMMNILSNMGI